MDREREATEDNAEERERGRSRADVLSESVTHSSSSRADQVRDLAKGFDDAAMKMGMGAAALRGAAMGVPPAAAGGGGLKEALVAGSVVLGAGAAAAKGAAEIAKSTADKMDAADKARQEAEKAKVERDQRERERFEREIRDGGRDFDRSKAIDRARDLDRAETLSRTC